MKYTLFWELGASYMSAKLRSLLLAVLALAATVVIATVPGVAPQVALLATTALIMGGAGHPLSTPPDSLGLRRRLPGRRMTNYIIPSGAGTRPTTFWWSSHPEKRILGFGFDPSFTFSGIFDGPFDKAVADGQKNLDLCIKADPNCATTRTLRRQVPPRILTSSSTGIHRAHPSPRWRRSRWRSSTAIRDIRT